MITIKYKINGERKIYEKSFETTDVAEAKKAIRKSLNLGDEVQFVDIVVIKEDTTVEFLKNMFNIK